MAINHLKRRGFGNGPVIRPGERVTGRRARKVHRCALETCPLDNFIELDDVYVEHAIGEEFYTGRGKRYHLGCGEDHGIIVRVDGDATNKRRQAILATRHRREA